MADLDTNELLYVAGIGLLLNILAFSLTILITWCHPWRANTDLEAANEHENDDLNAALLQQDQDGPKLIDRIPKIRFWEVMGGGNNSSFTRGGCCICLKEGFNDDELCKILPECNHVFHSDCIDQWLKNKQSCPVCRKVFRVVLPLV